MAYENDRPIETEATLKDGLRFVVTYVGILLARGIGYVIFRIGDIYFMASKTATSQSGE